ncbi:polyadenylate-binding protein-interacting protein 6-like [Andrographis paniculata]|uniref:polyadenylate-binding protein-interacting protein 6-like n=1 Tax=Andrographis paniculata TaxID=175694 RepID=UPI0021E70227|nr:polyadenylate-binding protein-interacting protein 6-like [Andrographis paniculata]
MNSRSSSLNPFASPYTPLSKRVGSDVDKGFGPAQEFNRRNEAYGNHSENILPQQSHRQKPSWNDGAIPAAGDFSKWKKNDHRGGEYFSSSSRYAPSNEMMTQEKTNVDEDMDLAYLQMTFPGISYESLHSVYITSRCDLDAAVDMINQLEIQPHDPSDKLPDSLDIGDVPEMGAGSSQKAKGASSTSGW